MLPAENPQLAALLDAIRACRICRDAPLGAPLPHEPRPVLRIGDGTAPILICGQAPGTKVHQSGIPFDDASGDTLRSWLGIDRDAFYDRNEVVFDLARARAAALAALRARRIDARAVVSLGPGGTEVEVSLRTEVEYVFAGAIPGAPGTTEVRAQASAELRRR